MPVGSPCLVGKVGIGRLPIRKVFVGQDSICALVDTGCSDSMVRQKLVRGSGTSGTVVAFDGRPVTSLGRARVGVRVGELVLELNMIVVEGMIEGIDMVLGMDAIERLGGVYVINGEVQFGHELSMAAVASKDLNVVSITDKDFSASFDGNGRKMWHQS